MNHVQGNTSTTTGSFNILLDEFIQKMIKTFPTHTKLQVWYLHFKTSKRFNPKVPMEYFINPLIDLGVQIMTKDENFFKKSEYVDAVEGFSEQSGLVDIWDTSSDEIKESIWNYIQSLYVISMNGIGETDKLREVVIASGLHSN